MKNIIKFSFPLIIGNLFQQFYNMADLIIVGRFVNKDALSAVGSVGALNFLIVGSIIGLCSGVAIPVAQSFGAKDEKLLKKYVANIKYLLVVLAVVFTVVFTSCTKPLLRLLNTPADIFGYAYDYIVIIFAGIGVTMLYNVLASVVRALGDSKTPLYFLLFSSGFNIAVDLLFIIVFKMGVKGAAYATVLAQLVSSVLCLVYVKKKFPILKADKETGTLDFKIMKVLLRNGLPMALQFSITALGTVLLQSCVNGLGSDVIAAMTIGGKTQLMIMLPAEAIGLAMATFAGQNLGAKRIDRVKDGIISATVIGIVYAGIAFLVARYLGTYIGWLFVDKSEKVILELAQQFLNTCSWFYPVLSFIFVYRNTLQGLGYSLTAMSAGVFELVARSVGGFGFVNRYGFRAACFVNPAAWIAANLLLIPALIVAVRRCKGKVNNEY